MLLRRSLSFVCLVAIGLLSVQACNDNDLGPEKRRPNRPPETVLASGPSDSTYESNYRVHIYWSGSDADGSIDHYDFILVDHPAFQDSITTSDPSAAHRVAVRVPAADDPRWQATTVNDTIIVTRADTLRRDPVPPDSLTATELEHFGNLMRGASFERWHTFFVRSVDNEGRPDPSPDYRSFNSRNVAPVVFLTPPIDWRADEFRGPPTIIFNWDGYDPIDAGQNQPPLAARWALVQSRKNAFGEYQGLPDTLYRLSNSAWSPWRAWEARDGSGRSAIVRNLLPAGEPGNGFYLFAVQALDEAGAVSPIFDWQSEGKNNLTAVFVNGDIGPNLTLRDPFLSTFNFTSQTRPVLIDVAAGQPISWCWRGDASEYGGHIVAYRYGWDLRNPGEDQEWDQNWSEVATCAPSRVFTGGTHTFFLEVRDNAESITHVRIELTVRPVTRRRELLIVDDSTQPQGDNDPNELREDFRWQTVIDSLRNSRPFVFDPARDNYDVRERNRLKPPLSLVFDYKMVVWRILQSAQSSALRDIAFFRDPFVEGQNSVSSFNYLNLYLDNGGKLWVCGQQPTFVVWPILGNRPLDRLVPVNILNWNIDQHPQEDSIATVSLLYRMGVEAMDLGSGGNAAQPRSDHLDQGCVGLRRSGGPGGGSRRFTSSIDAAHSHLVEILGPDVDLPPVDGVTYSTDLQIGHVHTVHLTQDELLTLRRGGGVSVQSSVSDVPAEHSHRFELRDPAGLWGAPAALEPDVTWPSPPQSFNPAAGRVNVEIYNMPSFCASQTPPLQPPPERVLALYQFVSVTPADHEAGRLYPLTADEQPVFLLTRSSVRATDYSRAWCGFEPWRLTLRSHVALARFVLLQTMHVGEPPP